MAMAVKQESLLKGILDVVARTRDGVFAVDEAHRIVLWNAAAEEILGYSSGDVLGRPCYEVTKGRDRNGNLLCYPGCPIAFMARREEFIRSYDMIARCSSGEDRWINVSTIVLPRDSGLNCFIVHLFRDISEERALRRLVEQFSISGIVPAGGRSPLASLTAREKEVLLLVAQGARTREIAAKLYLSPLTVRNHIHRILQKLGARCRTEAVALAVRYGLKVP
ncbi:MAG: PAS and helix-turn-helix domain-containing protein [Armatimonadota bacterium]|nr:PAS and helix-turn-helix domain-containing protein [Armatimonadota bacterium]